MIKQSAIGLNSRSETNPFGDNGFLPLITAPVYSVVDETNYRVFLDNKIQVCLPRKTNTDKFSDTDFYKVWKSYSLQDFENKYCLSGNLFEGQRKVLIDTANGNMPALHKAIRKAKEIHGDNLVIMAGNVSSVEVFIELAKVGCDFIRVGVGGGSGCNTSLQTGVGQEDLESAKDRWVKSLQKETEENLKFLNSL